MRVMYIVIGDLGRLNSGSGVRPNAIYNAFLERGHNVYVLSGFAGRGEGKQRKQEVIKAIEWAEANRPDICYIESSTYPMIHRCDYKIIRYLSQKGIPTAYFYRDLYRRFPELFPQRKGLYNKLKEYYLDYMQKKTDNILHKVNMVYFPSLEAMAYFKYSNMNELPPAGNLNFLPKHTNNKTCIYVGGVTEFYGYNLLMESFELLNRHRIEYRLILVCRKEEYEKVSNERKPEWLQVYHVSGDKLTSLYSQADIGLLALSDNEYANLSVGVKLFQYLSYGLPVLSTNVSAMSRLITENDFGEISENSVECYANAIKRMLNDDEQLERYRQAIHKNLSEKHLWVNRVDQIIDDLTGNKN